MVGGFPCLPKSARPKLSKVVFDVKFLKYVPEAGVYRDGDLTLFQVPVYQVSGLAIDIGCCAGIKSPVLCRKNQENSRGCEHGECNEPGHQAEGQSHARRILLCS